MISQPVPSLGGAEDVEGRVHSLERAYRTVQRNAQDLARPTISGRNLSADARDAIETVYQRSDPDRLTTTQDNWNLDTQKSAFFIDAVAAVNVTGIANGVEGKILALVNKGTSTVTLKHNDAGSTAVNRFRFSSGADIALAGDRAVQLIYDSKLPGWRDFYLPSAGGGTVSGSGSTGQVAYWSSATAISGNNGHFWDSATSRLGIGTTTPRRALDILNASAPQLRLTYTDNSVYSDLQTDSSGYLSLSPTGLRVGVNVAAPAATLDVASTTQLIDRIRLSGQEFFAPATTSTDGIALVLGVNRSNNRQLWIGDSALLAVNATNPIIRSIPNSRVIDCISTNGTQLSFWLGSFATNQFFLSSASNVGFGTATPAVKVGLVGGQMSLETTASTFATTKFNSQGTAWSSLSTLPSIIFNADAADRPEIAWIRGARTYPQFAIRMSATADVGGSFWAGSGSVAPNHIMTMDGPAVAVGINTTTPRRKLDILDTATYQLRLTYTDNTVYSEFQTTSLGSLAITNTGGGGTFSGTTVGGDYLWQIANLDNTNAASHGSLYATVGGESAGDPRMVYTVSGVTNWTHGIDNSDADKFKISRGFGLGTNDQMTMTTGGLTGFNTTTPRTVVDILQQGSAQLRLTYTDNTVYTDFQTDSAGTIYAKPTSGSGILQNSGGAANWYIDGASASASVLYLSTGTTVKWAVYRVGTSHDFQIDSASAGVLRILQSNGYVGFATTSPNVLVDVNGGFATRASTVTQITANQNDYAFTGGNSAYTYIRISSDASRNITGFTGGFDGKHLILANTGTQNIVLTNQDAASSAANRIITGTGGNITLGPDQCAVLFYDSTSSRWRIESGVPTVSVASGGVGGSGTAYRLAKFSAGTTIADSLLSTDSGNTTMTYAPASSSSGSPTIWKITGPAHTTLANAEAVDLDHALNRTVQFTGSLTLATQRAAVFRAPTYSSDTATKTITTAATLAVTDAPTAGTNVTITNKLAFWVQAGLTRLDGSLKLANNTTINFRNAADSADVSGFTVDSGNDITIGGLANGRDIYMFTTSGQIVTSGNIRVSESTPSTFGSSQNDFPLVAPGVCYRLEATGVSLSVTGFANPNNGRIVIISNVGGNSFTIANQSASSSASNRVITGTGAGLVLATDQSVMLWYDSFLSRWRVVKNA